MVGNDAEALAAAQLAERREITTTTAVKGDATVPGRSGDPTRVRPPVQESIPFQAMEHDRLSVDEGVITFLLNRIDSFF